MNNVEFLIDYADVAGFPVGSAVHAINIALTDSTGKVAASTSVAPDSTDVTLQNVPDGTYSYSIGAVDAGGVALGTALTGTVTAPTPTVSLLLPSAVTIKATAAPAPAPAATP
jgi:hypothetical protein